MLVRYMKCYCCHNIIYTETIRGNVQESHMKLFVFTCHQGLHKCSVIVMAIPFLLFPKNIIKLLDCKLCCLSCINENTLNKIDLGCLN